MMAFRWWGNQWFIVLHFTKDICKMDYVSKNSVDLKYLIYLFQIGHIKKNPSLILISQFRGSLSGSNTKSFLWWLRVLGALTIFLFNSPANKVSRIALLLKEPSIWSAQGSSWPFPTQNPAVLFPQPLSHCPLLLTKWPHNLDCSGYSPFFLPVKYTVCVTFPRCSISLI